MRKRFASAKPGVAQYLSCKYSPRPQVAVVSIEPTETNFRQLAAAAAEERWELEGWVGVQARRSQYTDVLLGQIAAVPTPIEE